jgi:hypothetical protein
MNIKENVKISAKGCIGLYEVEQHKPWFDEECLGLLYQRKQAKMQWLQDPNKSNVDNLNNVRREASRRFRNKKKEHLKAKIDELETNSKIKNIREFYKGISDFKKGYQPRTNIIKGERVIWLRTSTVLRVGGENISHSYSMCMRLNNDRQN